MEPQSRGHPQGPRPALPSRPALHTPGIFVEPKAGVERRPVAPPSGQGASGRIHGDFEEQGNGVLVPGSHSASPLYLLPPGLRRLQQPPTPLSSKPDSRFGPSRSCLEPRCVLPEAITVVKGAQCHTPTWGRSQPGSSRGPGSGECVVLQWTLGAVSGGRVKRRWVARRDSQSSIWEGFLEEVTPCCRMRRET